MVLATGRSLEHSKTSITQNWEICISENESWAVRSAQPSAFTDTLRMPDKLCAADKVFRKTSNNLGDFPAT
jgi:hypothetical protein